MQEPVGPQVDLDVVSFRRLVFYSFVLRTHVQCSDLNNNNQLLQIFPQSPFVFEQELAGFPTGLELYGAPTFPYGPLNPMALQAATAAAAR